jgi:hypothetical protein
MSIGMHQMPQLLGGCAPCGPGGLLVGMGDISVSDIQAQLDRALPPARPTPAGYTSLERTGTQVGSVLDRIIPVEYRPFFIAFAVGYWLGGRRR